MIPSNYASYAAPRYENVSNDKVLLHTHAFFKNGIELDPASSKFADKYVNAKTYYTPIDDGLNDQEWFDDVYLFPPATNYYWNEVTVRWHAGRKYGKKICSGSALWFRKMKQKWMKREFRQGIFFTNQPDIAMICQDIFDFPVCFMNFRPTLTRLYYADDKVERSNTGMCLIIYMPPHGDSGNKTDEFVKQFSSLGKILY